MNRFRCYLLCATALSILAGCAGGTNGATLSPSRALPQGIGRPEISQTFSRLYVADDGNSTVTMYLHPARKLKQTVRQDIQGPVSVAVDSSGTVYVANCGGACSGNGSVAVIDKNGKKVREITDGISRPESVAVDPQGDLYVANVGFFFTSSYYYFPASVAMYAPGSSSPQIAITGGVARPSTVALDASENVYVANDGFVTEYGPQLGSYIRSMTTRAPLSFAFDASGNLYVGNNSARDSSNVLVFAPGATNPFETIKEGVNQPYAMTIDPAGNLYVANTFGNNITVYAIGSTTPFATISQGIDQPRGITLDGSGNVYVANASSNSVTEYAAGTYTLIKSITQGVSFPQWLAFGP